jgi:hypothetical protein
VGFVDFFNSLRVNVVVEIGCFEFLEAISDFLLGGKFQEILEFVPLVVGLVDVLGAHALLNCERVLLRGQLLTLLADKVWRLVA